MNRPGGHCMTSQDHRIRVDVVTSFVEDQSNPGDGRFVFSYTITIRNEGSKPARLMARHWLITDANGKVQEVVGEGVVGEQPVIPPGTEYRYTSGTLLNTEVGSMHGSFGMLAEDGTEFDAPIAPFTLAQPGALH